MRERRIGCQKINPSQRLRSKKRFCGRSLMAWSGGQLGAPFIVPNAERNSNPRISCASQAESHTAACAAGL